MKGKIAVLEKRKKKKKLVKVVAKELLNFLKPLQRGCFGTSIKMKGVFVRQNDFMI